MRERVFVNNSLFKLSIILARTEVVYDAQKVVRTKRGILKDKIAALGYVK